MSQVPCVECGTVDRGMGIGRCEECTKSTMSHNMYAWWNNMMMRAEFAMACDNRVAPLPVKPVSELPVFCRKAHVKPRSKSI